MQPLLVLADLLQDAVADPTKEDALVERLVRQIVRGMNP
jgi:hypothetical protein